MERKIKKQIDFRKVKIFTDKKAHKAAMRLAEKIKQAKNEIKEGKFTRYTIDEMKEVL